MNIYRHYLPSLLSVLALTTTSIQAAEPSRLVFLEQASVAAAGTVAVDLGYDADVGAGVNTGIRIGLAGGEFQINRSDWDSVLPSSTDYTTTIGFKKSINTDLALYGEFGMIDREQNDIETDDATSIAFGAAYSINPGPGFFVSLNAELVALDDPGLEDETFIKLGVGALYDLNLTQTGKVYLLGELITDDSSDTDTTLLLGARWAVNDRVTIDFSVIENSGDAQETTAVPGSITVNLVF